MKNNLKKLLICGASLMMVASLGTGISNVSAKRVSHHYRPRTHRMTMSSRALYKLGEHDHTRYIMTIQDTNLKPFHRVYKQIINELIRNHFNKSYINGLALITLKSGDAYAGSSYQPDTSILSDAKKVMKQRNRKHNHKLVKRHARHLIKRNRRSVKRTRNRKHGKRRVRARKVIKRNRKRTRKPKIVKTPKKLPSTRSDVVTTRLKPAKPNKPVRKRVVAPKKAVIRPSKPVQNTQNVKKSTPTKPAVNPHDQTDGGKYYNWNQLEDAIYSEPVAGDFESPETDKKIHDSVNYNLDHWNYSNKQLNDIINSSYLNKHDSEFMGSANSEMEIRELNDQI